MENRTCRPVQSHAASAIAIPERSEFSNVSTQRSVSARPKVRHRAWWDDAKRRPRLGYIAPAVAADHRHPRRHARARDDLSAGGEANVYRERPDPDGYTPD